MDAPPNARRRHVAALLLLSAGLHAAVIARSETTARDGVGFIRDALHLELPPDGRARLDVVRGASHPPGYPLLVLAASKPVRAARGTTCDAMVLSAQLAAAAAGVLLVLPMYALGLRLFGPGVAFVAAGLFQTLPVFAAVSSDGLSDSTYLLMLMTALWLGVRAAERPTAWRFFACGVSCGAAYLVRPEGLFLAATVAAFALLSRRRAVGFAALLVGVLLVALPYAMAIGKVSNKPTWNRIFDQLTGGRVAAAPPALLATWSAGGESRLTWAAESLTKEALKTSNYVVGVLAVFGVWLTARRWRREPALGLPAALMAVQLAARAALAARIGYVSERHTLPTVMVGCFFAAAGLRCVTDWVAGWALARRGDRRFWFGACAGVLMAAGAIPACCDRLHANREGHRRAGEWLRGRAGAADVIWDPFLWTEFYAGRGWGRTPRDYPDDATVFVIVEERGGEPVVPRSKVPMYEQALTMRLAGRRVFAWPASPGPGKQIVVYRVDR